MNRAKIEELLPSAMVVVIRDLCLRLGIPQDQWPAHLVEFVDIAVLTRVAALRAASDLSQSRAIEEACHELAVPLDAFDRRRKRRRYPSVVSR